MTDLEKAQGLILEYVQSHDCTSFVELARHLEANGIDPRGDLAMMHGEPCRNIVLWGGMSETYFKAARELIEQQRLFLHPCPPLVYFIDGGFSKLPVAKSLPRNGFKHARWLPVTMRLVPAKQRKSSLRRTGVSFHRDVD